MVTFTFTHSNPGAIQRKMDNFMAVRSGRKDMAIIEKGLDKIYDRVFKDARFRTGYMRESIEVGVNGNTATISVGAYYGIFIEKGTRHHRAFPFFYGNVLAGVGQIVEELRNLYVMK